MKTKSHPLDPVRYESHAEAVPRPKSIVFLGTKLKQPRIGPEIRGWKRITEYNAKKVVPGGALELRVTIYDVFTTLQLKPAIALDFALPGMSFYGKGETVELAVKDFRKAAPPNFVYQLMALLRDQARLTKKLAENNDAIGNLVSVHLTELAPSLGTKANASTAKKLVALDAKLNGTKGQGTVLSRKLERLPDAAWNDVLVVE